MSLFAAPTRPTMSRGSKKVRASSDKTAPAPTTRPAPTTTTPTTTTASPGTLSPAQFQSIGCLSSFCGSPSRLVLQSYLPITQTTTTPTTFTTTMMRSRLLRIPLRPTASLFPRLNAVRSFSAEALEGRYPTHTLPPLPYENAEIAQNGLGSFMSGPAFSLAWTQYQTHLLRNLNDRTAGTPPMDYQLFLFKKVSGR